MGPDSFVRTILASLLGVIAAAAHADLRVPQDYATIGAALTAIENGATSDRVVIIAPGSWTPTVTLSAALPSGVVLRGEETARTFLRGGVVIDGAEDARISNFTFTGPNTGSGTGTGPAVRVNSGSATVAANVFRPGDGETAIAVVAARATIDNNVFDGGGIAIDAGQSTVIVENNAFIDNDAALSGGAFDSTVSRNAFFRVDSVGAQSVGGDPLFVDVAAGDFHLRAGSPLIDAGNGSDTLDGTAADIGAYGGDHAEGIPFPVQGLDVVAVVSDGLENSVELSWSPNRWYLFGGYRLHYGDGASGDYGGTGADQGDSPLDVGTATGFTLSGLSGVDAAELGAPVLSPPAPRDRALALSWSAVAGASGYLVYYRADGSDDEAVVDVGNVTAHVLGALANDVDYRIRVSAYAQGVYRFAVTAHADFDGAADSAFSDEVTAAIGARAEGPPSNEVVDFPEPIVAFPDLPDENGCFIATAAYGFYGADEVRLLRRFRDRHLLGHAPGRAFVAWYYEHSPAWAAALHETPALKSAVRLALLPAIALAAFTLHVPLPAQVLSLMCMILAAAAALLRRRRGRWRQC